MLYRLHIDLAFQTRDPIDDILDKALDHLEDAVTINPGHTNQERGLIQVEECYHDEEPTRPCKVLQRLETPG